MDLPSLRWKGSPVNEHLPTALHVARCLARKWIRRGADDPVAVQSDAQLGAWRAVQSFNPAHGAPFAAWAVLKVNQELIEGARYRSAACRALPTLRLQWTAADERKYAENDWLAQDNPPCRLEAAEEAQRLAEKAKQARAPLDWKRRLVVVLYYLEEFSCREVAEALGLTNHVVHWLLHESREIMRRAAAQEEAHATHAR